MTEEESKPLLKPLVYYGVTPEIAGNGAFIGEHSFAHLSGRLLVTEHLRSRQQTFWQAPKYGAKHIINGVAFDKKREIIVIADEGEPPTLCAYRLSDHKRLLYFSPKESSSNRFTSLFVHCDGDRVSALLSAPDNLIYTFFLEDGKVEAVTNAMHKNLTTEVTQVVGHLEDTFHYAILGTGIFRFMMWMGDIWEDVFRSFCDAEGIPFSCGTYTSYDTIVAGTTDGRIFVIAHDGIKAIHDAMSVERIYIEVKKKGVKPQPVVSPPKESVIRNGFVRQNEVKFMTCFRKGLVYCVKEGHRDSLHMFLKGRFGEEESSWVQDLSYRYPPEGDPFPKHGFIKIPIGQVKEYETLMKNTRPLFDITNLTMTQNGKCIMLTFSGRFFMILEAKCEITPAKKMTDARYMSVGYNTGPIDHVATCLWKYIFVTISDRTLKVYDYYNRKVYCAFTLQDYVYSVSLHPSGFYGILGLTDKAVLFSLNSYNFNTMMEFDVECCKSSVFSEQGHLLVLAEEERLRMYSVYSFQHKGEILDGHAGKINYMWMCPNDAHLWTSRTSGIICQTNVSNGVIKYLFQSTPIKCFAHYDNYRLIYVTTYDGVLKEIDTIQDRVSREANLRHGDLAGVVSSQKRGLIMVGAETGYVLVFKIPWDNDEGPIFKSRIHYAPIMKIALSRDENFLLTSAKDGSVCIWEVMDFIKPEKWEVIYSMNVDYPCRANCKSFTDFSEIKNMLRFEADYFNRQEKLISYSTLDQYMKDIKSIMTRMKDQMLDKNLYEATRYKLLELKECRNSIDGLAREFINETEYYFDRFIKNQAERMKDEFDVDKACKQAADVFHHRYIEPMKQMFDKMKEYRMYLTGTIFHDVKEDITDDIRNKLWFMKHYRKKSIKRLKEIISKGQNLLSIKSSPKFLAKIRKMRRAKYRAKELMRSSIHKEIVMILKVFRMIQELKRLKGERVKHPYDSDNEASLPFPDSASEKSCVSETFSAIHSDNPLNPLNLDKNLSKRKSPTSSISWESDTEVQQIFWPKLKMTNKYKNLFKHFFISEQKKIRKNEKGLLTVKYKPYSNAVKGILSKYSNSIQTNKHKAVENDRSLDKNKAKTFHENINNKETLTDETITGKSVTIRREKGFLNKSYVSKRVMPGRLYEKAFSKLMASRKKQKRLEASIANWKPDMNNVDTVPLNKPLTRRNFALIYNRNVDDMESLKLNDEDEQAIINEGNIKPKSPTLFEIMYNMYIHPETVVKEISPFHLFKRKFPEGKFKSLLLKYSPSSKLCSLATKHLISLHLLRLYRIEQEKQITDKEDFPGEGKEQTGKRTVSDILDYDVFSDVGENIKSLQPGVSEKDSFFSMSSVASQNQSDKADSLSSIKALSDLSKSTLPKMLQPLKNDTQWSTESGLVPNPGKTDEVCGKTLGLEPANAFSDVDSEQFKNNKYITQEEKFHKKDLVSGHSLENLDKKEKFKRWEKVNQTIYNESVGSDSDKNVRKLLQAVERGEREFQGNSEQGNKVHVEDSYDRAAQNYKTITKNDLLVLKKLNVINEKQMTDQFNGESLNDIIRKEEVPNVRMDREIYSGDTSSTLCSYDPLELTDLLEHDKQESSFVRMGKLERIPAERVKYDIVPEKQWRSFDPPISKDFMNTLLEYQLLTQIKKEQSTSEVSSIGSDYSVSESEHSSFNYDNVRWTASDTNAWKIYFTDENNTQTKEGITALESGDEVQEEVLIEEGFSGILDEELYEELPKEKPMDECSAHEIQKDIKSGTETEHLKEEKAKSDVDSGMISTDLNEVNTQELEKVDSKKESQMVVTDSEISKGTTGKEGYKRGYKADGIGGQSLATIQNQEVENKQIEEYFQFLKKFKNYFVSEELFPCLHYLPPDETRELDEEEDFDVSESILDEKSIDVPQSSQDISGEEAETEIDELRKDGFSGPHKTLVSRDLSSATTRHDGHKSNRMSCSKSASRLRKHKHLYKQDLNLDDNKKQFVKDIWKWWNELLHTNKLKNESINLDDEGSLGILQTDGMTGIKRYSASSTSSDGSYECSFEVGEDQTLNDFRNHIKFFGTCSRDSAQDALISSYNVKLWKKLFPIDHPKTVDSYEQLSENLQKRKRKLREMRGPKKLELPLFKKKLKPKDKPFLTFEKKPEKAKEPFKGYTLKSNSEISFGRLLKKSMPKEKDPDAPSDEIESISSASYIVHVDKESDKYSLFMRQTVRIKTRLKNKIWFIPEGGKKGEFTKGKFYYPGEIWTKGRTSVTLRYNKLPITDPEIKTVKTSGQRVLGLGKSLKRSRKHKVNNRIRNKGKEHAGSQNKQIRTRNVELTFNKPSSLGLLKKNLEKVKFIKINMRFGSFYVLPFQSKKFWDVLSKAIGNRLTIKLRSEIIQKCKLNKIGKDVFRKKSKPLEPKINIDSSGDLELKVVSLEKVPLNKKDIKTLRSKPKVRERKDNITTNTHEENLNFQNKEQLPSDQRVNDSTKETHKKLMYNLVAEFFPKAHHGSFYKKIRMKKWIFLFKEALPKLRENSIQMKINQCNIRKHLRKQKEPQPFQKKYLKELRYLRHSDREVDKSIKDWVGRHIGQYRGPQCDELSVKEVKSKEIQQPMLCKSETSKSKMSLGYSTQGNKKEPPDQILQKVNNWISSSYRYLKETNKSGQTFSLNKEILQFGTKHKVTIKKNVPAEFIHRVQDFDRALKRSLKPKEKLVSESTETQAEPSRDKGNISHTDIQNNALLMQFKCPEDSQEQLFGKQRWKEAMYPSKCKKEKQDVAVVKTCRGYKEGVVPERLISDWKSPNKILTEKKEYAAIKPYSKTCWPYSILKVKTQIKKKIMPGSGKGKYEEPLVECISPLGELLESNKRRLKYKRLLRGSRIVGRCGHKLNCLRPEVNSRLSGLPTNLNLTALDNNYHYLKRIREHFLQQNIRDLKNYFIYVNKVRELLIEEHDKRLFFNRRQDLLNEQFEEYSKFKKEKNIHETHTMQWSEKIRRETEHLRNVMQKGHREWDVLENMKCDIQRTVDSFYDKSQKTFFIEALKELLAKYLPHNKEMERERNIVKYFKKKIVKNIDSEVLQSIKYKEQLKNPKNKALMEANRYVQFAQDQNLKSNKPPQKREINYLNSVPLNWTPYDKLGLKCHTAELSKKLKETSLEIPMNFQKSASYDTALFKEMSETLRIQTEEIQKLEKDIKILNKGLELNARLKPFLCK